MHIPPADRARDADEWRDFVRSQGFGHLIASGPATSGSGVSGAGGSGAPASRSGVSGAGGSGSGTSGSGAGWPVVAPTQFLLDGDDVLAHFARPNPILDALSDRPAAVLSVAGDWAFVPSDWKAIDGEDPLLGIPTTYYAAVQLRGRAEVVAEPSGVAAVLRRQLAGLQPGTSVADPEVAHPAKLLAIRAVVLHIEEVGAKFKYGGNVDEAHRRAVVARLEARGGSGDAAAARRVRSRLAD